MCDSTESLQAGSLPPQLATFDGFLFDMDGTIVDTTTAVMTHWYNICNELGVDPEALKRVPHGYRSIDVLKMLAPEAASWEYVRELEGRLPLEHADKVVEIPGARRLLDELTSIAAPWTIVTSSTSTLVSGWLNLLRIAMHIQPVTSESVEKGKPDPACYILGREKLGLVSPGKEILVVEDSPTGIVAAKAAGCRVIGLTTSHSADQIAAAKPDWIVQDFESLKVVQHEGGRVTVEISNALQSAQQ